MRRVAIVGGGISGLSAAYYLSRAGLRCTLIEARPRLGGVICGERVDGCLVEGGPDSFLAQKPWALDLIHEIGLEDQVIGSNDRLRKTYILRDGRLIVLPDGIQFLVPTKLWPVITSQLLGVRAKAKIAIEWLRRPGRQHPDRSVAQFVEDHFGTEVNEYLAQPMLAGVYGGSPENLSVHSVLPAFVDLERRYGSLTRGVRRDRAKASPGKANDPQGRPQPLFLTLKQGMRQLVDALAERLESRVRIVTGTAQALDGARGNFRLRVDGETVESDEVILATPAYQAAELAKAHDAQLAKRLGEIRYTSSMTASLLYPRDRFDRPLDGFGFLVPRAEGMRLTACTWVNTKFPERVSADRVLLRAFLAAEQAQAAWDRSDERVAALVHEELSALMGFRADPVEWRLYRWPRAMAQYEVGHKDRIDGIEARLEEIPGLHLAGNAYTGIGIPDCIRRSKSLAEKIVAAS